MSLQTYSKMFMQKEIGKQKDSNGMPLLELKEPRKLADRLLLKRMN